MEKDKCEYHNELFIYNIICVKNDCNFFRKLCPDCLVDNHKNHNILNLKLLYQEDKTYLNNL
jgi:hypothetical protein